MDSGQTECETFVESTQNIDTYVELAMSDANDEAGNNTDREAGQHRLHLDQFGC